MSHDSGEVRVRALLAAQPTGRELARAAFEPIGGGGLNRSWRVDTGGRAYFVRLANPATRALGADGESEAALLAIAGARRIAPRLVLALPSEGLLVTEFLAGRMSGSDEVSQEGWLVRLARLLAELHALPPAPTVRRLDFSAQAAHLRALLDPGPHAVDALARRADAVFARLRVAGDDVALCHNDVHHANLVDHEGRLRLVDWEYGGVGDPVYDIAGFMCRHALDVRSTSVLLDAYKPGIRRERLLDACWAYDYVQWLWYRLASQRATLPVTGAGFAARAVALGARLERAD